MKKIHRHDTHCTSTPPSGGPASVATLVNAVQSPTARPASSPYVSRSRARLFVVMNAAATPCTTRAAISTPPVGARPARTEASANPTMPATKVSRRPPRSPIAPAGR